jgi:hypothetical protein
MNIFFLFFQLKPQFQQFQHGFVLCLKLLHKVFLFFSKLQLNINEKLGLEFIFQVSIIFNIYALHYNFVFSLLISKFVFGCNDLNKNKKNKIIIAIKYKNKRLRSTPNF